MYNILKYCFEKCAYLTYVFFAFNIHSVVSKIKTIISVQRLKLRYFTRQVEHCLIQKRIISVRFHIHIIVPLLLICKLCVVTKLKSFQNSVQSYWRDE